ncbi:MAG: chromosome segregation protein SMC, partial [Cypionkella sp.]|nr:chromosome segregation protein SMC [Cypionkella sp.]
MARARLDAADASRRAGLAAEVSAAQDKWTQACAARDVHAATLDATCAALGLPGAALADLRRWLDQRIAALGVRAALRQAEDTLARAEADLRAGTAALQGTLGLSPDHGGFDALWAIATARLEASEKHRDARGQLAELQADLHDRIKDHTVAEANAAAWLTAWQTASASTALSGLPADSAGLGDMLDLLDALGRDAALLAGLTDRIAKMEQNRVGFRDAVALILLAIQLPPETRWADLPARLRQAEDATTKLAELSRNLADDREVQLQDQRQAEANAGALNALGAALGWAAGGASLGSHIADCQRAAQLRRDMIGLRADLANRPQSAEGVDFSVLTAQEAETQAALELRHSETQAAFAVLLEAKRQLSAVGGDDAVARLEAERANLLNALRDGAKAHLARRFGLIAVEQGLRRYRDSHRSAMLDRASAAFHSLSRGAYTGLAAQPDGATEVLVALSAAGGAKLAADLSKGTRFQLYLAL